MAMPIHADPGDPVGSLAVQTKKAPPLPLRTTGCPVVEPESDQWVSADPPAKTFPEASTPVLKITGLAPARVVMPRASAATIMALHLSNRLLIATSFLREWAESVPGSFPCIEPLQGTKNLIYSARKIPFYANQRLTVRAAHVKVNL